jgi:hypothetical protein
MLVSALESLDGQGVQMKCKDGERLARVCRNSRPANQVSSSKSQAAR